MPRSIAEIVHDQRRFFESGATRPPAFRRRQLEALKTAVKAAEAPLLQALHDDMRKPAFEAFAGEVGRLYKEIGHAAQHLERWSRPRKLATGIVNRPGTTHVHPQPFGVTLIVSPWNYPVQLALSPLIGAIAAGNCVIVKPSELAPRTSALVSKIIGDTFDPSHVTAVEGGPEVGQGLLDEKLDFVFFTGSPAVGKLVLEKAARNLVPVVLELGGKNPVIVDEDARLDVAARRIAWGKFFNAGQTCIAPDYLLVHERVKGALCERITDCVREFFGSDPGASPDFARIVNDRHFQRLSAMLAEGRPLCGGTTRAADRYIAPTVLDGITPDSRCMQEEVFGPILPVLEFATLDAALAQVRQHPEPLALYYFSESVRSQERVLAETRSGGACINETTAHTTSSTDHPFGGIGRSGMGSYHGRYTFDAFSHERVVHRKSTRLELKLRYPPYGDRLELLRRLFR